MLFMERSSRQPNILIASALARALPIAAPCAVSTSQRMCSGSRVPGHERTDLAAPAFVHQALRITRSGAGGETGGAAAAPCVRVSLDVTAAASGM